MIQIIEEIVVGEGWLPWNGGTNPVGEEIVEAHVDGRDRRYPLMKMRASIFDWDANRKPILAYRAISKIEHQAKWPVTIGPAPTA